jgi:hypothetical protein
VNNNNIEYMRNVTAVQYIFNGPYTTTVATAIEAEVKLSFAMYGT